jgi:hypothetical protein
MASMPETIALVSSPAEQMRRRFALIRSIVASHTHLSLNGEEAFSMMVRNGVLAALADIANTRSIAAVIFRGIVVDPAHLEKRRD